MSNKSRKSLMANRIRRENRELPTPTSFDMADRTLLPTANKGPATDVRFNPKTKKLELVYGDQQ